MTKIVHSKCLVHCQWYSIDFFPSAIFNYEPKVPLPWRRTCESLQGSEPCFTAELETKRGYERMRATLINQHFTTAILNQGFNAGQTNP